MRDLVASDTLGRPRSARETVAIDTPAARATSSMLVMALIHPQLCHTRTPAFALPLCRSGKETPNEESLQGEEHDERNDDREEGAGGQQVPGLAVGPREVGQQFRDREVAAGGEDRPDQQVVPDPEELQDGEGCDG